MLRRAEKATLVMEPVLIAASLARMGRWDRPLFSQKPAPTFVGGTLIGGIAAPLALHFSGEHSRGKSILSAILVLIGGLLLRFDMVQGGKMSADDPEATFTFARGKDDPPRES